MELVLWAGRLLGLGLTSAPGLKGSGFSSRTAGRGQG